MATERLTKAELQKVIKRALIPTCLDLEFKELPKNPYTNPRTLLKNPIVFRFGGLHFEISMKNLEVLAHGGPSGVYNNEFPIDFTAKLIEILIDRQIKLDELEANLKAAKK